MMGGLLVIGEVMVELRREDGAWRLGFAGDTFNTAALAADAGLAVRYLTAVGTDPLSREIVDYAAACGIGVDLMLPVAPSPPSLYAIHLDPRGERSFQYWRANGGFARLLKGGGRRRLLDAAAGAACLYLSGITLSLFSPKDRRLLAEAAALVRRNGGFVAFDPNYRPARWPDPDRARAATTELSGALDTVLATFDDEAALWGDRTTDDTIARWNAAGVREVVVKVGRDGCVVGTAPPIEVHPAVEVAVVDTSGAGDAFNAAYLAARLRGEDMVVAAAAGNALAGRSVRHAGALGLLGAASSRIPDPAAVALAVPDRPIQGDAR